MRKRVTKLVVKFMADKPLNVITTIFSIRDLILALAFIVAAPDATQTLLYQNIDQMISPVLFGIVFGLVCLFTAICAIADKINWTRVGLDAQAFFWLFAGCVYFQSGSPWLALIFGLFFSLSPGYISYYFKYTKLRAGKKHLTAKP